MKKIVKKLLASVLAIALVVAVAPVSKVEAAGETWINNGDGWHYLQGTDIKVKMADNMIRISGSGDLPDFDYWELYKRPWDKTSFEYVTIDDTITSIGKYAFYGVKSIKHVTMDSKTFIKDLTSFEGISYMPIFRINGKQERTEMIGTIPYTSLDSIKAFAQTNSMGACYIFDDKNTATAFQTSVNPSIWNVYWATDEDAPWTDVNSNSNGGVATPILRLANTNPDPSYKVSAQRRYPGKACYEAYAAFIGDYTFATTYSMVVEKSNKVVEKTDKPMQYTLTIPQKYRQVGRSFRLLAIGYGVVNVYDDLDMNLDTITFETDTPTTAYALVYK